MTISVRGTYAYRSERRGAQSEDDIGRWLDIGIEVAYSACYLLVCFGVSVGVVAFKLFDAISAAQFLQGTTGVVFALASVLILVGAMLGTQKQLVLSQKQSDLQEQEFHRRFDDLGRQRRLALLDRALSTRFDLLYISRARNTADTAMSLDEISKLIGWAKSYITSSCSVTDLRLILQNFLNARTSEFVTNPYVSQLRQILVTATKFSRDEGAHGSKIFIDHAWNGLLLEERIIAILLLAGTDGIDPPSDDALETWADAIDRIAPWGNTSTREILKCPRSPSQI